MSFNDKHPNIQEFILSIAPNAEGLRTGKSCSICSKPDPTKGLDDDLSVREFKISGMCKECQDEIFDPES